MEGAWWVPVTGCVAPTSLGWAGPGGSGDHAGMCPSPPPQQKEPITAPNVQAPAAYDTWGRG